MREVHVGEEVLDRDGQSLGRVERFVVDEKGGRITHLVVDGHIVGIARLRETDGSKLTVDLDRAGLESQPPGDLEDLITPGPHWLAPAGRRLTDFLAVAGSIIGQAPFVPPIHLDLEVADEHEITRNSPVWSGQTRLGEVDEVVLGDDGERVNGLLVRGPGILGRRALVPADRIVEVVGSNVHVDLSPEEFEALADA